MDTPIPDPASNLPDLPLDTGKEISKDISKEGQQSTTKPSLSEVKDTILRALDVKGFYENHLSGQRLPAAGSDGWTERVLCPVHGDKTTPNFFVNMETGGFKCFGCNKSGSAFDFWIYMDGRDPSDRSTFADALVAVADFAGVKIEHIHGGQVGSGHYTGTTKKKAVDKNTIDPNETFIPKLNKADDHDASHPPIPASTVMAMHKALTHEHYEYFFKQRGFKKGTVEAFCLGWDATWRIKDKDTGHWAHGRYTYPIPNKAGQFRNIRGYSNRCDGAFKMVNYVKDKNKPTEQRFGTPPRLFGLDRLLAFHWKHVVICEGEAKMILLNQYFAENNLQTWGAVSSTHGGASFEAEWVQHFFGCSVYICLDCDEPGKQDAHNIANEHFLRPMSRGKFECVKIITLPLSGTKESKDLTDYFVKLGNTFTAFMILLDTTPELIVGGLDGDESTVPPIPVASLTIALKDRTYIDQRIKVNLTISGETNRFYHAIREYRVYKCPFMNNDKAECCWQDVKSKTVPYGDPQFIAACGQSEAQNLKAISLMTCQHDQPCKVMSLSKVVMEAHMAHQVVKRQSAEELDTNLANAEALTEVMVYILQPPSNMKIEPQDYEAVGFVRTHPHTSLATFFIESLVPIEEDWKQFTVESPVNQTILKELQKFSIDDIISDITNGVTRIYDSDQILYLVLLTYLSPLRFVFNGAILRGWLNTAIVGDSGTGKSKTYERFADWIEVGDTFSGLSGKRTGLLYAIKQRASEWYISVGKYVRACGKILAIDECQEIDPDELKSMAIAMDTGYLDVAAVASGGYNTSVRAILLMNPKNAMGKAATLAEFVYGCDALKHCFSYMFIRRLDAVVFVTGNSDHAFYNKKSDASASTIRLSPLMMRTLIHWAWTRRMNQIKWSEQATDTCLQKAIQLSSVYGYCEDVPLVNPQDFRENLARLSTAYAVLDRNFSEDLQCVHVEQRHVEAMAKFVDMIYSTQTCNLAMKSRSARSRNTLGDFDRIKASFEGAMDQAKHSPQPIYRSGNHFCQMLLLIEALEHVQKRNLSDQLAIDPRWVQTKLAILQGFNLISTERFGYAKTKKFNLFMQQWRAGEYCGVSIASMLDGVLSTIGNTALIHDSTTETFVNYDPSFSDNTSEYDNHPVDVPNGNGKKTSVDTANQAFENARHATAKSKRPPPLNNPESPSMDDPYLTGPRDPFG